MSFADFTATFDSLAYLLLLPNATPSLSHPFHLSGTSATAHALTRLAVHSSSATAVLTVHLPDKRQYSDEYAAEAYGAVRLEVLQIAPRVRHVLSTRPQSGRDVSTTPIELEAGEYLTRTLTRTLARTRTRTRTLTCTLT